MNNSTLASVYSVSDLAFALKKTIESSFEDVRVRGEVSEAKRYDSGHIYFSLKDSEAVLKAVCWKGVVGSLPVKPEDGMEVICTGRLTTYPARSYYQITVTAIELAGQGALLKMLEERKKRLAAEGLFDAARKKTLPFLPQVIGLVTSPTGAVIQDILHRLQDRFPRPVLLWPVNVQGEGAAAQVAAAIEGFNTLPREGPIPRPDLLIVARGGGSLEDLMAFNEEIVVRATAFSRIPIISAVGHETDTTLIDFASDWRAPTPTAAAERAVPVRADLLASVLQHHHRLFTVIHRLLKEKNLRVESLSRGLGDPKNMLLSKWQVFHERGERLSLGFKNRLTQYGVKLSTLSQLLESFSFEKVLARGYALVTDQKGHVVTSIANLKKGQEIKLRLQDGGLSASITGPLPTPIQGQLFED